MKKLLLFLGAICITLPTLAQQDNIVGHWQGTLVGTKLHLVFHITEKDGVFTTKMDSPDQGAFGIPCDKTDFTNGKLVISLAAASGSYEGSLTSEGVIIGKWSQRGASIALDLVRKEGNEKPEVKPQTPKPPFSYVSEDVEYENAAKDIHYGATLTYPKGPGPFPAVILITGSGLQDRDETIGAHKPFAVIADHLTKNGVAVLRVDDRGKGKTTGEVKNATSADFAKDVEVSLTYLKSRKEIDVKKIGLVGHSEGGMIAPMVTSTHNEIAFVVLLAGPGIPIIDLMTEQSQAILQTAGVNEEYLKSYISLYRKLMALIPSAKTGSDAKRSATDIFQEWQKACGTECVKATTGVIDSVSAKSFVNLIVDQAYSPWFRYFLQYNPKPYLEKIRCPVLALNGEKDVQVIAKSNLAGITTSLKKNKKNKIRELPGLNHLFQTCKTCTVGEYFTLEETFSPKALEIMSEWINSIVPSGRQMQDH